MEKSSEKISQLDRFKMIIYFKSKANIISTFFFTIGLPFIVFAFNELSREPVVGLTQDNQTTILIRGSSTGNVQIEFYEVKMDSQINFTDWEELYHSKDLTVNLILKDVKYKWKYFNERE